MQQWVSLGCRYCPSWHCTCLFSLLKELEGSLPSKATRWTCSVYGTAAISTDSFVNTQTNIRITCKYRGRGNKRGRKRERNNVRKHHISLQTAQLASALTIKSYSIDLTNFDIRTFGWQKCGGRLFTKKKNPTTNPCLSSVLLICHTMVSVTNW